MEAYILGTTDRSQETPGGLREQVHDFQEYRSIQMARGRLHEKGPQFQVQYSFSNYGLSV